MATLKDLISASNTAGANADAAAAQLKADQQKVIDDQKAVDDTTKAKSDADTARDGALGQLGPVQDDDRTVYEVLPGIGFRKFVPPLASSVTLPDPTPAPTPAPPA